MRRTGLLSKLRACLNATIIVLLFALVFIAGCQPDAGDEDETVDISTDSDPATVDSVVDDLQGIVVLCNLPGNGLDTATRESLTGKLTRAEVSYVSGQPDATVRYLEAFLGEVQRLNKPENPIFEQLYRSGRLLIQNIIDSSGGELTTTFPAALVPTPTSEIPLAVIPAGSIQVEPIFTTLSFSEMTNLFQPNDNSGMIFVTEQRGIIHTFTASQPQDGSHVFLDISDRVNRGGNEEGLLGIAFDPDYQVNGYFYVYYSADNPRRSVLSRFGLKQGTSGLANPQSEVVILEVEEPFANHNGGQIAFGPDGYLYIGLGDGGGAGDPQGNAQNLGTLLGSILRIDVSGLSATGEYRIPPDNPFVDTAGVRPEIWAFGLRNPWRFSFDPETSLLWAADVGQNAREEIDIITRGGNYGWNTMEGFHCYSPASGCDQSGLMLPLFEYDHSQGCSVTGGYVYRGVNLPTLRGYYIYGDYCSGNIWALGYQNGIVTQNILLTESDLEITSFGEDLAGNLYLLSRQGGIYILALKE